MLAKQNGWACVTRVCVRKLSGKALEQIRNSFLMNNFKVESQVFFPLAFVFMFFKASETIIDPILFLRHCPSAAWTVSHRYVMSRFSWCDDEMDGGIYDEKDGWMARHQTY